MSCAVTNKTKEQLADIVKHRGALIDPTTIKTQADLVAALKFIDENLIKPKGENARYTFMGVEIHKRVSDIPKKVFEKRYGKKSKEAHELPDNIIFREGGTKVHAVLEGLVRFYANKEGNIHQVKKDAMSGDFALDEIKYGRLVKTAKDLVKQINEVQDKIDSKGKAEILVELGVLDPVTDTGGTIDVLAVFSDMSIGIYDYKTIQSKPARVVKREGQEALLLNKLTDTYKMDSFTLSLAEYKRIVSDRYFSKIARQSRIIPIHIGYKTKTDTKQIKKGDALTKSIDILQSGADMSTFLRQIPVAGESTKFPGLDKLLEKQAVLIRKLEEKLETTKLSTEERDRINRRVKALRDTIEETMVSGDIRDLLFEASRAIDTFTNRVDEPQFKEDNTPNHLYLTIQDLQDIVNELEVYQDIIEDTASYFGDLKDKRPELYETLKRNVDFLSGKVQRAYYYARRASEERVLDHVTSEYKDEGGNLIATDELTFGEKNFSLMSEIDHPIFKAAWERIQRMQFNVRRDFLNLDKRVADTENALISWSKSQGISRLKAYGRLINFDTGRLYSSISPELIAIRDKAYADGNVETLKKIYQIRDIEKFKKDFEAGAIRASEYLKGEYNNLQDTIDPSGNIVIIAAVNKAKYNKRITEWVEAHDLINSSQAWFEEYNRNKLEFKPEILKQYKSNELKEIEQHKPLLDYYNMFTELNDEFRELLGLRYADLPNNFIPNIRRELIEHIDQKGTNFGTAMKEMWQSIYTRVDEDVHLGDVDTNGELRRNIPLLFTNPLKNRNGDIDNTIKSYDLGKSLRLFGKMAYNYNYMNEIEPTILALKDLLGNSTPDQGGTQVTDTLGRRVKGPLSAWATKKGISTDTYKVFEDLTDVYLYGLRFKEKSFVGGMNTTQVLLRIKEYHAKRALAFAVIPAIGAAIAGRVGTVVEGRKGMSFTTAQQLKATGDMYQFKHYKGLSMFFEPYAEDPSDRITAQRSATFASRYGNTRTMFLPLRKVDENITDNVLNAMAYNYGLDENGNLVRMNKPGADLTSVKSIKELYKYDEKTGEVTIPNITDKAYIAFRQAVKNTVKGIIGSLSREEVARYDANLIMNLMMAFKSWMPGVVTERIGKLKYDPYSQMFKLGRFRALAGELSPLRDELRKGGPSESAYDDGIKLMRFMGETVAPAIGKLILDLGTFGLAPSLGLKRVNVARAKRRFIQWQLQDKKHLDATFEDYLEVKEKQIKAALIELRMILGFMALILFLGGEGEDGEPRYMDTWFFRTIYKVLTKAESELSFMWNPDEFMQMVKNPIPLTGLLASLKQTVFNTADEALDWATGRPDTQDKTPIGYYSMQWMYGGSQIARLIEIYKQYEKSPY